MAATDDIAQEPVKLRSRRILMITGGTVVVTIAAVAVSGTMLGSQRGSMVQEGHAERPSPPAMISAPVSGIENSMLEVDRSAETEKGTQLDSLRQWSWEDKDAGVARIPIDRAMEWMVQRSR